MERAVQLTHTDLVSTRKRSLYNQKHPEICCPTRTMRHDVFEHTVSPAMPFEPGDVIGVFHPWFEDTNVQLQIDPKAFSLFYAYSTYNEDYVTPPYAHFRVSNATASIGALFASVEISKELLSCDKHLCLHKRSIIVHKTHLYPYAIVSSKMHVNPM